MSDQEIKAWKCPNGHTLGAVVRNGSKVRTLLLYREALEVHTDCEVDVIATIDGYAADVRCSICGGIRSWVPGQESLDLLLRRAGRMRRVEVG